MLSIVVVQPSTLCLLYLILDNPFPWMLLDMLQSGRTALHHAALWDCAMAIKLLYERGADVNDEVEIVSSRFLGFLTVHCSYPLERCYWPNMIPGSDFTASPFEDWVVDSFVSRLFRTFCLSMRGCKWRLVSAAAAAAALYLELLCCFFCRK